MGASTLDNNCDRATRQAERQREREGEEEIKVFMIYGEEKMKEKKDDGKTLSKHSATSRR